MCFEKIFELDVIRMIGKEIRRIHAVLAVRAFADFGNDVDRLGSTTDSFICKNTLERLTSFLRLAACMDAIVWPQLTIWRLFSSVVNKPISAWASEQQGTRAIVP